MCSAQYVRTNTKDRSSNKQDIPEQSFGQKYQCGVKDVQLIGRRSQLEFGKLCLIHKSFNPNLPLYDSMTANSVHLPLTTATDCQKREIALLSVSSFTPTIPRLLQVSGQVERKKMLREYILRLISHISNKKTWIFQYVKSQNVRECLTLNIYKNYNFSTKFDNFQYLRISKSFIL